MLQKSRTPTAGVAKLLHTIRQFFQTRHSLPMRHTIGYLVTMLFNIVSDFSGNDLNANDVNIMMLNIW